MLERLELEIRNILPVGKDLFKYLISLGFLPRLRHPNIFDLTITPDMIPAAPPFPKSRSNLTFKPVDPV